MDDNKNNPFQELAGHEWQPPEPFYENIMKQVSPAVHAEQDLQLKQLAGFELKPPPALADRILEATHARKTRKKRTLFFLSTAAAAALLLAIFLLYPRLMKDPVSPTGLQQSKPAIQTPDSSGTAILQQPDSSIKNRSRQPADHPAAAYNRPAGADGHTLLITDNDLLYSLMECRDCDFSAYYTRKMPIILDVDQYSSVTVSVKMMTFMKDLYSTNKRQHSTARARKARRQLNRWKNTDEVYFDHNKKKMATDPLDLLEFIMENKK